MAPYLAAFSTQHKDEDFLRRRGRPFPRGRPSRAISRRKAWLTDTYAEVNGVSRTIQALAATARRSAGRSTVITCLEHMPPGQGGLKNFTPVGTFPMPEYESQSIAFPPFLEVIEYIERQPLQRIDYFHARPDGPGGTGGGAAAGPARPPASTTPTSRNMFAT